MSRSSEVPGRSFNITLSLSLEPIGFEELKSLLSVGPRSMLPLSVAKSSLIKSLLCGFGKVGSTTAIFVFPSSGIGAIFTTLSGMLKMLRIHKDQNEMKGVIQELITFLLKKKNKHGEQ